MASVKDQVLWNNSRKSWLLYIFLKLVCFLKLPFAIADNDDGEVPQTNNFSSMLSVLWAILLGILFYLMWKKYFGVVLNANLVQTNYDEHNNIPEEIIDEPCDEMRDGIQNKTNHELCDGPINEKRDDECDKASDERFNARFICNETSNEAGPKECNEIHNEASNEADVVGPEEFNEIHNEASNELRDRPINEKERFNARFICNETSNEAEPKECNEIHNEASNEAVPEEFNEIHNETNNEAGPEEFNEIHNEASNEADVAGPEEFNEIHNEASNELRDRPINEKRDDESDKASDERFNARFICNETSNEAEPKECNEIHNETNNEAGPEEFNEIHNEASNEADVAGPEEFNAIHNEARNELVKESRNEKLNEIRSECEKSGNELSDDSQCEQYIKSSSVSALQCQSNVARDEPMYEKLCDDDLPSTSNERSFGSSSVIVDDQQPSTSRGIQRLRALPVCIVKPVDRNGNSLDRSQVDSATNRNKRQELNDLLRTHSNRNLIRLMIFRARRVKKRREAPIDKPFWNWEIVIIMFFLYFLFLGISLLWLNKGCKQD
ncbi:myb-like protein X [Drosophila nasuta]|uniref:myb-like protein X n=1 Tax=Drosophila nasuta TaxID=42062 RepID=UPI00295F55B7|nr:myb-like protein X [Drosophila nasuta]